MCQEDLRGWIRQWVREQGLRTCMTTHCGADCAQRSLALVLLGMWTIPDCGGSLLGTFWAHVGDVWSWYHRHEFAHQRNIEKRGPPTTDCLGHATSIVTRLESADIGSWHCNYSRTKFSLVECRLKILTSSQELSSVFSGVWCVDLTSRYFRR